MKLTGLRLAVGAAIMTAAIAIHAPLGPSASSKDPALTVRGVGLGSSPKQIVSALGNPLREVPGRPDDMPEMGPTKEMVYRGASFDLCKPEGQKEFHVYRVVIQDSSWTVNPGIRIGMAREQVVHILGQPNSISTDASSGQETLQYDFISFDGWYWMLLSKGRVVEIGATEDWS